MFYDLSLNYDNFNSTNREQYQDLAELVTSAICGNNK